MAARGKGAWLLAALIAAWPADAGARESLGMFAGWGAFRDPAVPRCYAIALSEPTHGPHGAQSPRGYADVGSWPRRQLRGKIHFRLSRAPAGQEAPRLVLGGQRFALVAGGGDAWPQDAGAEAAIVAAMRSAATMTVSARGADGHLFTDSYKLAGAASAMDSALVGCAGG